MGNIEIDTYLSGVNEEKRAALQNLRETIRALVPGAEECISYRLPAFRFEGRMLVGYGATSRHCALYLMSSLIVDAHSDDLAGYDTSKGTVRFSPEKPLPHSLVRTLVMARVAENRKGG